MLAVERAVICSEGLQLAVNGAAECIGQFTVGVACKQWVPVGAPQQLDHIPAGTTEQRLEFIDDMAVAAHRSVESLQIAVDDEYEVVEFLARGQRQRRQRFRFIHFAIAKHAPHLAVLHSHQSAMFKIAHEARLIHRTDRAESH